MSVRSLTPVLAVLLLVAIVGTGAFGDPPTDPDELLVSFFDRTTFARGSQVDLAAISKAAEVPRGAIPALTGRY